MCKEYFSRQKAACAVVPAATEVAPVSFEAELLQLTITRFYSERDNVPKQREVTWQELCRGFSTFGIQASKAGSPVWSPVSYIPEGRRGNAGVDKVFLAVADIDNGTPFEEVKPILDGYAYLAHSSYSHLADKPKYRIIVPLAHPVNADDWSTVWHQFNAWIGNVCDVSTKDPARIYYVPCKAPEARDYFIFIGEGKALNIQDLPVLPCETLASSRASAPRSYARVQIEGLEESIPELNPAQGFREVLSRCLFMQAVSAPDHQNGVSEPEWAAMISNACVFEDSEAWIHEASCHHDAYDETTTEGKIERFRDNYAPTTCQRIQALGFGLCPSGGCLLASGRPTKAPAGLWTWLLKRPVVLPFEQLN